MGFPSLPQRLHRHVTGWQLLAVAIPSHLFLWLGCELGGGPWSRVGMVVFKGCILPCMGLVVESPCRYPAARTCGSI